MAQAHLTMPALPPPGTQSFFPALLTHIHDVAPGVPLDPIIVQSILLCLIGDKNLILRTHEEDVRMVVRLAALTLTCIFAYPTHKLRIRQPSSNQPPAQPSVFLRSLFLPEEEENATVSISEKKRHSASTEKKRHSFSTDKLRDRRYSGGTEKFRSSSALKKRSSSTHAPPPLTAVSPHPKPILLPTNTAAQTRNPLSLSTGVSYSESTAHLLAPSVISPSGSSAFSVSTRGGGIHGDTVSILRPTSPVNIGASHSHDPFGTIGSNPFATVGSLYPSGSPPRGRINAVPRPSSPDAAPSTIGTGTTRNRRVHRAYWTDDEDGMSHLGHGRENTTDRPALQLPRALVISGLENTSVPSQRAFTEVLAARRILLEDEIGMPDRGGVWNLPEGFFVVYVCPFDPRERPAIHKSLLDRFAMSSTVSLQASARHTLRFSRSHSYRSTPSPGLTMPTFVAPPPNPLTDPNAPIPIPKKLMLTLRTLAHEHTSIQPTLSLYISDLFSAVRHHPELDAMLLGARAHRDVEALMRAGRVIGGDPTGAELVRAVVSIEEGGGSGSSVSYATTDSGSEAEIAGFLRSSVDGYEELNEDGGRMGSVMLDISDADIARIAPRVMSHRLRVRDGPREEIFASTVFSAVRKGDEEEEGGGIEGRSTIKDILVKILSEV